LLHAPETRFRRRFVFPYRGTGCGVTLSDHALSKVVRVASLHYSPSAAGFFPQAAGGNQCRYRGNLASRQSPEEIAVEGQFLLEMFSFINDTSSVYEIRHYLTKNEKDVFMEWRCQPRDAKAKIAIDRRVNRMELGNFGDHKPCRDGVSELRIDVGPGYRVYYTIARTQIVLLLCGGDKRTQDADIARACEYWLDWQERAEK